MPTFETPPESKAVPHYLLGAASPLWAYFATAAAGGVAFWWMTRWTRPVNLEAMLAEPAVESSTSSLFESATIDAVAEPEPEPAPRPRVKKSPPTLADEG